MQPLARFATVLMLPLLPALAPLTVAATRQPATAPAVKPLPAQSQNEPQSLGGDKGWTAWTYTEKGNKVCYLVGHPAKSEPANLKRGRIDLVVTHRPHEKATNVINVDSGYLFKEGSDADIEIDGHKFSLFTAKDAAWSRDAATDKSVVEALAKGKQAIVKGTSARGSNTSDSYALAGFAQTLALIDKACSVRR